MSSRKKEKVARISPQINGLFEIVQSVEEVIRKEDAPFFQGIV